MVPSETGLPLQSRTGAVSSSSMLPLGFAVTDRLQGSPGTSWITRLFDASPARATNSALPSRGAESIAIQATPLRAVAARVCGGPEDPERVKETGTGAMMRLRQASKRYTTPLTALGRPTGRRDGSAKKATDFGAGAGVTTSNPLCGDEPVRITE